MPKDSHLLPQHSQDLLRAARSGRIYKRPAPAEEEEADPEAIPGDKPEKKDDDPKDKGFTAKAWKQIPRHMEGPDIEYLAKRRKGLVTIPSKTATGPILTKTTVKRFDAAGNEYVQDVVVPRGQKVEGEIIAQTTIPDLSVSGSVGEGFAVQPTPPKRKGPIIRKKPKGPGRGRKKKILAPTSVPQNAEVDGAIRTSDDIDRAAVPDVSSFHKKPRYVVLQQWLTVSQGTKAETEGSIIPAVNGDTEMAEDSILASDDDDGEDGEEGEDGEGNDDDEGSIDNQSSPPKPPLPASPAPHAIPVIKEIPKFVSPDLYMTGTEFPGPSEASLEKDQPEGKSGSPLKNVVLTTSSLTSPLQSPTVSSGPATFHGINLAHEQDPEAVPAEPQGLDGVMQQETVESTPIELPPPSPELTTAEAHAVVGSRQEEEDEEEMLLDIVENASNAQIGEVHKPTMAPFEEPADPPPDVQEPEVNITSDVPSGVLIAPTLETDIVSTQEPVAEEAEAVDDDDFPDLLVGLEEQLNKPVTPSPIVELVMEPIEESVEESVEELVAELATEAVSEAAEKAASPEKLVESEIDAKEASFAEKEVTDKEDGS
jgi:hypothetical protein